jgi:hypothetical protein
MGGWCGELDGGVRESGMIEYELMNTIALLCKTFVESSIGTFGACDRWEVAAPRVLARRLVCVNISSFTVEDVTKAITTP